MDTSFDVQYEKNKQEESKEEKPWLNHVLVVVCCRLGMKNVQAEYIEVIRYFYSCKLNVGILGGRPGEAYYLVGMQD